MGDLGPVLWTSAPKALSRMEGFELDLDYSGIAHIAFEGDRGESKPWATLSIFRSPKDSKNDFLALERFVEAENNEVKFSLCDFYFGKRLRVVRPYEFLEAE